MMINNELLRSMSAALVLTVLIEGTAVLLLTRKLRFLMFSLWCNLLTNPALNLSGFVLEAAGVPFWCWVIPGEALVFAAEAWMYRLFDRRQTSVRRCIFFSCAANGLSFGIGLLLGCLSCVE